MALNTKLPDDIICLSAEEADDDFDSRYMAKKKTYSYYIKNSKFPDAFSKNYTWHFKYNLDIDEMKKAIEMLDEVKESIMNAYHEAVEQEYRFFSFGDAMFIEPPKKGESL